MARGEHLMGSAPPVKRTAGAGLSQYFPFLEQLRHYNRQALMGDLTAGLIVAIMLIPQGMAYALLAGLPPQQGLYASILPLVLYGLLGTSRHLAVGPVAIVSLLTAASVGAIASEGSAQYIQLAITLALLVGILQTGMGLLRLGFLVNFLSHPVLVGFSSAAAIVIGFSQVKNLLGVSPGSAELFWEQLVQLFQVLPQTNWITLALGLGAILLLWFFKNKLAAVLARLGVGQMLALSLAKMGPLVVVVVSTLLVVLLQLNTRSGVSIVGDVPAGLPPIAIPDFDLGTWRMLLTTALAISFVGYMESISVAKSLASKKRQKVDANQELIALGVANLGATFTGGYPVTGGFSRSLVNYAAGAETTMASIFTALLVGLSVLLLTPLFFFIPKAVLAAIILVAVAGLIDFKTFLRVWQFNKRDAIALIITFVAVLAIGIENGILVGAVTSLVLFIERTSNPHCAIVGRLPDSQFYRNVNRFQTQTWPDVSLLRVDASLYFGNVKALQAQVSTILAEQPELKHLVLIGTAINDVDFSALEALEAIWLNLVASGVTLHLSAFKGPVLDKLEQSGFLAHIGRENLHLTTHDAMRDLGYVS
ncbi:MAG: sulfate permease [Anaerolineales bacterium]|nr:sulfate permease [Anaerolineales bacterium]